MPQCRDLCAVSLSLTGMVIRPKADETFEIVYNIQNTESWDMYAQALDKFLSRKSASLGFACSDSKSLLLRIIQRSRLNCFLVVFFSFFYLIRDNSFMFSGLEIALHQGF